MTGLVRCTRHAVVHRVYPTPQACWEGACALAELAPIRRSQQRPRVGSTYAGPKSPPIQVTDAADRGGWREQHVTALFVSCSRSFANIRNTQTHQTHENHQKLWCCAGAVQPASSPQALSLPCWWGSTAWELQSRPWQLSRSLRLAQARLFAYWDVTSCLRPCRTTITAHGEAELLSMVCSSGGLESLRCDVCDLGFRF